MNTQGMLSPVILPPGKGREINAFGQSLILHLGGEETGKQFALFTGTTPPGGGPPPHYHEKEDEWFFVEGGRMSFWCNGTWTDVEAGGLVYMPKGSRHTFKNNTDKPVRMKITAMPSGFEVFYQRCADEFAKSEVPDAQRIIEIAAEHGIYFVEE